MYLGEQFKSRFKTYTEWFEFYGKLKEEVPADSHNLYGKYVEVNTWVDSYHNGDILTCSIHTGLLVVFNLAPIVWQSKQEATIES